MGTRASRPQPLPHTSRLRRMPSYTCIVNHDGKNVAHTFQYPSRAYGGSPLVPAYMVHSDHKDLIAVIKNATCFLTHDGLFVSQAVVIEHCNQNVLLCARHSVQHLPIQDLKCWAPSQNVASSGVSLTLDGAFQCQNKYYADNDFVLLRIESDHLRQNLTAASTTQERGCHMIYAEWLAEKSKDDLNYDEPKIELCVSWCKTPSIPARASAFVSFAPHPTARGSSGCGIWTIVRGKPCLYAMHLENPNRTLATSYANRVKAQSHGLLMETLCAQNIIVHQCTSCELTHGLEPEVGWQTLERSRPTFFARLGPATHHIIPHAKLGAAFDKLSIKYRYKMAEFVTKHFIPHSADPDIVGSDWVDPKFRVEWMACNLFTGPIPNEREKWDGRTYDVKSNVPPYETKVRTYIPGQDPGLSEHLDHPPDSFKCGRWICLKKLDNKLTTQQDSSNEDWAIDNQDSQAIMKIMQEVLVQGQCRRPHSYTKREWIKRGGKLVIRNPYTD